MKLRVARFRFGFALGAPCIATAAGEAGLDRTTLPIAEPQATVKFKDMAAVKAGAESALKQALSE